ncbi:polysaccharide lyase [Chania multitudinisentens]|uniref:polysaccharide lyase n=1 Tax=Chania multitudinisentens TaxID=1639108 RepID=UPI0003E15388|nr:hypothetical protein [Chania multitudinisentens]
MDFFSKHGSGKRMTNRMFILGFVFSLAACDNSNASSVIESNNMASLNNNAEVISSVNDNKQQNQVAACSVDNKAWWPLPQGKNDTPPASFITRVNFQDDTPGLYTVADFTKDWGLTPGNSSGQAQGRLNIVADPDAPANKVLRVTYSATAGQDATGNPTPGIGGNSAMTFDAPLPKGNTALWLQYKVRFDERFTWVRGGKLPGLGGGGKAPSGCIDNSKFNGFTTRLMWREQGSMYNYLYYPTKVEHCGDYAALNTQFLPGQWYTITQYVQLGDPGQSNGQLIQFVDGVKVLELDNWNWRADNTVSISTIKMDTFFGGGTLDWAPQTDQYAYFDDFTVTTASPLGLVTTHKSREQQENGITCHPQPGYQAWSATQSYPAGSLVYAVDGNGEYHYYQARSDIAAGISPGEGVHTLLDIYDGVVISPVPVDLEQPWLEQTVAPWYGNGATPGASWTTGLANVGGSEEGEPPTEETDDGAIKWNLYTPLTNGGLMPNVNGAVSNSYGTANQFAVNGNLTPFSINPDNTLRYDNTGSTVTTAVRLCNTGSCDNAGKGLKASADSVTNDGYPKGFTWLACVKANEPGTKNALEIEVATGDFLLGPAYSSRVKTVIQKTSSATGVQLNSIDGSSSSVVQADTSQYHLYQVSIALDTYNTGSVNLFIDGKAAKVRAGPALPYSGVLNSVSLTGPGNYLSIGSGAATSTATSGSMAWFIWTKEALSPADIAGSLPENALAGSPCDLSAY